MKKKEVRISERLYPVILYLDDIKKIVDIMEKDFDRIKISTEEYEFESFEEFYNEYQSQNTETLKKMTIWGYEKDTTHRFFDPFHISIDDYCLNINIQKDNSLHKGISENIKKVLKEKKRLFSWEFEYPKTFYIISNIFFWTSLIVISSLTIISPGYKLWLACLITILYLLVFVRDNKIENNEYCLIYLKEKNKLPSFWKRKKDDIILVLISSIGGAVIGSIITYYLHTVLN